MLTHVLYDQLGLLFHVKSYVRDYKTGCLNMFQQCFTPCRSTLHQNLCNPAHRLENADSVGYLGHVVRVLLKFLGTQISSCLFISLF